MRKYQRLAIGRKSHPADVFGPGSERTESIDRRCVSTTASRPPKASATTSLVPSTILASSRGQNGNATVPKDDSPGLPSGPFFRQHGT